MENFIDSCVVIHYANYTGEKSKELLKKCFKFIQKKEGKFIICYASLRELRNYKTKIRKIHRAVINKLRNKEYKFSNDLDFRSVSKAKQLYVLLRNRNPFEATSHLNEQRINSMIKIDRFLEIILDEKVIPIEKINDELVNKIHDYIDKNHADCKILASALQLQKERSLLLFVTADKDFFPNEYDFLKGQFEINYSKEDWKFPKLKNFLFEI